MDKISLLSLIKLYKVYWWKIKEDTVNYVVLENPNIEDTDAFWNKKNISSIPKYLDNFEDFRSTFNLKAKKLLKYTNKDEQEELNFKINEIFENIKSVNDRIAFRFLEAKQNINLTKIKNTVNKLYDLIGKYSGLVWKSLFNPNKLTFQHTTTWSFVLNIGLPVLEQSKQDREIIDDFNPNTRFVQILESIVKWDLDSFLVEIKNYRNKDNLKSFISKLKEFNNEILWDTEIYYFNKNSYTKVAPKISKEEKEQILETIKEIEDQINKPYKKEILKVWILELRKPIWKRISKIEFLTLDDNEEVFVWSDIPEEKFKILREKDKNDNNVILKDIEYMNLWTYSRILDAEIV